MTTTKLGIKTDISQYLQQFNCIVRFAHNRYQDGKTQTEVENEVKITMKHIKLMDSSFIKSAVDKARNNKDKEHVIFGGKYHWKKYNKELKNAKTNEEKQILKQEYKDNRNLRPLIVRGETSKARKGNRKFELDMKNNQVIFKPSKDVHIPIQLPELRKELKDKLIKLQELCEAGVTYFTCGLSNTSICITYDEEIVLGQKYFYKDNRVLSFDSNPNFIAVTICDYHKTGRSNILYKEIIDLTELNQQTGQKIKFEMLEISNHIVNLAKHYKVETIGREKLDIQSGDKGKGHWFNHLVNNDWRRNIIFENLQKWSNITGFKYIEVIPHYSSFIGQIDNPEQYDSIAAALEIGRRTNLFVRKYHHHENINVKGSIIKIGNSLPGRIVDRWKKKLDTSFTVVKTYLDLYNLVVKKLEYSYRLLYCHKQSSLRLFSINSHVYTFL